MLNLCRISFARRREVFRFFGTKNYEYRLHQLVEMLQVDETKEQRLLWRLDEILGEPVVLVQSEAELNAQRLLTSRHPFHQFFKDTCLKEFTAVSSKKWSPAFLEGQVLRFRL